MTTTDIAVILDGEGNVQLRNWRNSAVMRGRRTVDLTGLDGRVLRLFEGWLRVTDRIPPWSREELRVFGQLLHRRLFTGEMWEWVEQQRHGKQLLRLMLAFPTDAASSRLAALPWEFLCSQDQSVNDGDFLVLLPWLVVSRVVPSGAVGVDRAPKGEVRVLPVVGIANDQRLGPVEYEDVLSAIDAVSERPGFSVLSPLVEATAEQLKEAVRRDKPYVVHFMGHGRFRDAQGAIALKDVDGGPDWLPEDRLADLLCPNDWATPIVILHACEGGANDYETRFAGLAPAITRRGALCVVAMQYAVLNSTAIEFSTALYDALADRASLDFALQRARLHLWEHSDDPRLIGVPSIYQRSTKPLLVSKQAER